MSFANLLRMHSLKQEFNILNNAFSPNKYVGVVCCVCVGLLLFFLMQEPACFILSLTQKEKVWSVEKMHETTWKIGL